MNVRALLPILLRKANVRRRALLRRRSLTATAEASMAARALLFGSIAVLAIDRAVTPRFERHSSLLSAPGTGHAGTARLALVSAVVCVVSTTTRLLVFLCLTAGFAAFGTRITTFTKELLFLAGKREFLPAVAAHQLEVSHGFLSFPTLFLSRDANRLSAGSDRETDSVPRVEAKWENRPFLGSKLSGVRSQQQEKEQYRGRSITSHKDVRVTFSKHGSRLRFRQSGRSLPASLSVPLQRRTGPPGLP